MKYNKLILALFTTFLVFTASMIHVNASDITDKAYIKNEGNDYYLEIPDLLDSLNPNFLETNLVVTIKADFTSLIEAKNNHDYSHDQVFIIAHCYSDGGLFFTDKDTMGSTVSDSVSAEAIKFELTNSYLKFFLTNSWASENRLYYNCTWRFNVTKNKVLTDYKITSKKEFVGLPTTVHNEWMFTEFSVDSLDMEINKTYKVKITSPEVIKFGEIVHFNQGTRSMPLMLVDGQIAVQGKKNSIDKTHFTIFESVKIELEKITFIFNYNTLNYAGKDIAFLVSSALESANGYDLSIEELDLKDEQRPIINGGTGVYISNYDHPTTLQEILSHIEVIDDVDGNITDKIVVESNHYYIEGGIDNRKTIGEHLILLSATDSAGNKATFTVIVKVVDITSPVITGPNNYEAFNNDLVSIDTIKALLSASDNVDGNITNKIILKTDNYTDNYNKVGKYAVIFEVIDLAGNKTEHTITLNVGDKINPIINGTDRYNAFNNALVSINTLKALLSAMDETDGNITHKITLKTDSYTTHYNKVGNYPVIFEVMDLAGNKTSYSIMVNVFDKTVPTFGGKLLWENISNLTALSLDTIKSQITALDDVDGNITARITLKSDNYLANYRIPGEYYIIFEVTDTAGNKAEGRVILVVYDKEIPVISGTEKIVKDYNTLLTVEQIKAQLTANDIISGNLTANIIIKTDNYTGKANIVGTYTIVFEVSDTAGNKATHLVTVEVKDNLPPVFIVDGFIININEINNLSIEQIISILRSLGKVDSTMTTYQVVENTYIGNESVAGVYKMSFKFTSPNGTTLVQTLHLKVYSNTEDVPVPEPTPEIKELNKWQEFCRWVSNQWQSFLNTWKNIGAFFGGIVNWVKDTWNGFFGTNLIYVKRL